MIRLEDVRVCLFFLLFLILSPQIWGTEKDYYKILGISPSASEADIKKAYRSLAMKYHPDRKSSWEGKMTLEQAEARFKDINEANDTLKDSAKRAKYDRTYKAGGTQQAKPKPNPNARQWKPQDFSQARPRPTPTPRPKPKVDPVAEYLKKMRSDFSAVKNKTASAFSSYVQRVGEAARTQGKPKLQEALKKFVDSTVDVFFATNPTVDDLARVKVAYGDPNFQLNLDKKWLERSPTRADYINRVKLLQGDTPRAEFLRQRGAVVDTTAESFLGKGASSSEVFREIDEIENMEKMKAAQAQERRSSTYDSRGRTTSSGPKVVGAGSYRGPCNSAASVKAMETYINNRIGPTTKGSIIDLRL